MVKPSTIIKYSDEDDGWRNLNTITKTFLETYEKNNTFCNAVNASEVNKPCKFDTNLLGDCKDVWCDDCNKPCFYITLNTDVINVNYKAFDQNDLPEDMSKNMRKHIQGRDVQRKFHKKFSVQLQNILSFFYSSSQFGEVRNYKFSSNDEILNIQKLVEYATLVYLIKVPTQ